MAEYAQSFAENGIGIKEETTIMEQQKPLHASSSVLSDEEKHEAIEEALRSLAEKGLIFDTGRRRWSERTGTYQIVWAAVPGAKFE